MLEPMSSLLSTALGRQVARPVLQDQPHAARLQTRVTPRRRPARGVSRAAGQTRQTGQTGQTGAARRRLRRRRVGRVSMGQQVMAHCTGQLHGSVNSIQSGVCQHISLDVRAKRVNQQSHLTSLQVEQSMHIMSPIQTVDRFIKHIDNADVPRVTEQHSTGEDCSA